MNADAVAPVGAARRSTWLKDQLRNIAPFVTLIFLCVVFSLASPSFLTLDNFANILRQVSVTAIIATGLTFVILTAEIDLSVASVANATGILVAFFTAQEAFVTINNLPLPGGFAIILALLGAFLLGGLTAFGVTRIGIPSFIMTLAMLQIGAGICAMLVRGQIAYAVPNVVKTLGSGSLGPVPWIVIVAALFLLTGHIVLTYTRFGRYIYSGVAGMLGVAYFGSAQQNEFDDYLLDAIAAVVVGGTSLFGGQGGIGNTIIGLFVLGVLNNGLDHVNIDSFLKVLIRGLILLLALVINVYAQRLREAAR
jgi:ribose transport system permease protein